MRILYLTFFESVTDNGLYKTQVKQLLCKLAGRRSGELIVSHFAFLPAVEVWRKGLLTPFVSMRHELAALKSEYLQQGVTASIIFLPIIILKRWRSTFPLPLLGLFMALSVPILFCRIVRQRPDIIHCRSYIATILAIFMKWFFRDLKVVFDPRGFWPEEGVVMQRWGRSSITFRVWKGIERYLLRHSDKVIALSESFADRISELVKGSNCVVIYASADVNEFKLAGQVRDLKRRELGLEGKTVFVYNGSLHAWHDPLLLAQVHKILSQSIGNTKLLVITGYDRGKLEAVFRSAGLHTEDFLIVAAKPSEVAGYLVTGDFGLVPLREICQTDPMAIVAQTMIGTKVAEYLACGLPVIVNKNVGGMKSLMGRYRIGIFFDSKNLAGMVEDLQYIRNKYLQTDCELVAERYFSLDQAAEAYYQVYSACANGTGMVMSGGSGNSGRVVSGCLVSPRPPGEGERKEGGNGTDETESRSGR